MYFDRPVHDLLTSFRKAIVWGYGHYFVFAAAAAVGAGLAVVVDQATGHSKVSAVAAAAAVAVPVAVFVMSLWVLHDRPSTATRGCQVRLPRCSCCLRPSAVSPCR